jgi:hypothetical protein
MRLSYWLACAALIACPLAARAEHARIDLKVIHLDSQSDSGEDVSATVDTDPPTGGRNPRPLAKATAGEPLALQFFLTNTYPHGVIKNVTVRYYVVREEKRGQKAVPDLKKGTVAGGQFTMNFKPNCRVGSRVNFRIKEPGFYLLRVETINTDSDHEHFSAIDIEVKKAQ